MHYSATTFCLALSAAPAAALFQVPAQLQKVSTELAKIIRPAGKSATPVPEVEDAGFWFADWEVGASKSLSMLIDTGSSDVYLNPGGVYKPGSNAQDEHRTFTISFETTNSDGSGSETLTGEVWRDLVSLAGFDVKDQELGNVTTSTSPTPFPHDGLVGFAGLDSSAFGATPWFDNVCKEGLVEECRFGLAFGTDGKGTQTLGGVDPKYANSLSSTPALSQWKTAMEVATNNQVLETAKTAQFDSGTTVVYGPINDVKKVYEKLGVPTATKPGNPSYLYGYYPCDKPPTVGFKLGGTIFNLESSVWPAMNNGGNNCTGVVQGTDAFGSSWLIGQAFFQGKYVDHDIDGNTMGFAKL